MAFALRHSCSSQLDWYLDGRPGGGAISPLIISPWGKRMSATFKDIGVSSEGHVGIVEIQRPPHNFFDNSLINQIADAFEAFDRDGNIRAYVLCAQGKSFCAGADFANRPQTGAAESGKHLYKEATRLFRSKKPSVGGHPGPGDRRRPRPCRDDRLPRHLRRRPLRRQLHAAGLPSRLLAHLHPAAPDRPADAPT